MKNLGGKKDAMEFARIHANLIGSGLWTTFYPKQHTKQVYHNTITVLGFNITQHSSTTKELSKQFINIPKVQVSNAFRISIPPTLQLNGLKATPKLGPRRHHTTQVINIKDFQAHW